MTSLFTHFGYAGSPVNLWDSGQVWPKKLSDEAYVKVTSVRSRKFVTKFGKRGATYMGRENETGETGITFLGRGPQNWDWFPNCHGLDRQKVRLSQDKLSKSAHHKEGVGSDA